MCLIFKKKERNILLMKMAMNDLITEENVNTFAALLTLYSVPATCICTAPTGVYSIIAVLSFRVALPYSTCYEFFSINYLQHRKYKWHYYIIMRDILIVQIVTYSPSLVIKLVNIWLYGFSDKNKAFRRNLCIFVVFCNMQRSLNIQMLYILF